MNLWYSLINYVSVLISCTIMSDSTFVQDSLLDILVPEATGLNIEEALQIAAESPREGDSSLTSAIPQRNLLYFGKSPIGVMPSRTHVRIR